MWLQLQKLIHSNDEPITDLKLKQHQRPREDLRYYFQFIKPHQASQLLFHIRNGILLDP